MIFLDIGFLLSFLVPVFIGSWRIGFLALAAQGLILAGAMLCLSEEYSLAVVPDGGSDSDSRYFLADCTDIGNAQDVDCA